QILEAAKNNGGFVFLDEAYIEFSDDAADHVEVTRSLLAQFDNLVILRTLSKAYGLAGIRLGYLLGSNSLISEFEKRCAPFNIAQPTLQIAADALAENNQADVENFCQQITANRNQLFDWFIDNNIPVLPSQANFLVLQLANQQAAAIESFLAKNGILIRSFGSDDLSNCLRITIPYKIGPLQQLLKQALKPDLICLDMDGVLIDTSGSYDATIIATVKQISNQTIEQSEIDNLKNSGGYNNDWVVSQKLLEDRGFDLQLSEVIDIFQQLYLGENNDGFVSNEKPLINNTFIKSIKQSSSTFAIVTGRPLNEANAGKNLIDLGELDLISLDCVKQPKPSPEGIERLQKQYSTLSWMCGDNPDDMQAAFASNSLAIGIRSTNKEPLYEAGADIVLNNINELEDWLCPLN
ncbi:MAG: aminotransferase class I/II-fold pyridoxal phosphate-dependent enzyme, partial [Gammaproteobacteria bacterium]|nr:aminotransferase class I/II-fold pyridoxal phosphate-dependent enzyme [Gammaproteobacteria bacterium]